MRFYSTNFAAKIPNYHDKESSNRRVPRKSEDN